VVLQIFKGQSANAVTSQSSCLTSERLVLQHAGVELGVAWRVSL